MNSIRRAIKALAQRNAFKRKYRSNFYRAMYLYQRAGARKLDALEKLRVTYESHVSRPRQLGNRLARLFGVHKPIFQSPVAAAAEAALRRNNVPLAEALCDWIPPAEQAILAAGEDSGNLAEAFQMASRFTRQQGGMWAKAINALAYPMFMILAVLMILYFIAGTVMPAMNVASTSAFSPWARFVLWCAHLVYDYWLPVLIFLAAMFVAMLFSLSRWKGRWRVVADRYPPWSIYRRVHGALFLYSYAVLQRSGVSIQAALANLAESANPWLRTRILAGMYGVRQGYDLGQSFRRAGHEFPDWEALPVLESISSLSGAADALIEYAENWLDDTSQFIDVTTKRANAAMLFWLFGWIALLSISVLEIISFSFK